mmetsp:Transcript_12755/g.24836  ORF Transcript_12755/g.24836 Transcript_12755/m.24836 type:complete len:228 (-) Transcript_12755:304-987(-)
MRTKICVWKGGGSLHGPSFSFPLLPLFRWTPSLLLFSPFLFPSPSCFLLMQTSPEKRETLRRVLLFSLDPQPVLSSKGSLLPPLSQTLQNRVRLCGAAEGNLLTGVRELPEGGKGGGRGPVCRNFGSMLSRSWAVAVVVSFCGRESLRGILLLLFHFHFPPHGCVSFLILSAVSFPFSFCFPSSLPKKKTRLLPLCRKEEGQASAYTNFWSMLSQGSGLGRVQICLE